MHLDQWMTEVMIRNMSALNHTVVLAQWWLAPRRRTEAQSQMDSRHMFLMYNLIEFLLHAIRKITCIRHEIWEAEPICEKSHDIRHHPRVLYRKSQWSKLSTIIYVATYCNTYLDRLVMSFRNDKITYIDIPTMLGLLDDGVIKVFSA
jgi:hypothetical protein